MRLSWLFGSGSSPQAEALRCALRYPRAALHLTNASPFAAPGGLERFVLELCAYGRTHHKTSSIIMFPSAQGISVLADEKELFVLPVADTCSMIRSARAAKLELSSFHLQHTMHWQHAGLLQLVEAGLHASRSFVHVHDYHFLCRQHNLLWNDGRFCGPPVDIERGDCSTCKYGDTVHDHRELYNDLISRFDSIIIPSETAARIFLRGYPEFAENVRVIPHRRLGPPVPKKIQSDEKPAIVFLGATGFNKGIDRYSDLIASLGDRFRWITVGIEDYYSRNPLVQHQAYSFHEGSSLQTLLDGLHPAVAFLGSIVPETFSFTLHEALQSGMPVLTTHESGNIAAIVQQHRCGRVFGSFDEMKRELAGNGERMLDELLAKAAAFPVIPGDWSPLFE